MVRDDDIKKFILINLVGSLYKLLAKVLVHRLGKVIGNVVFEYQNAFARGRH